MHMPSLWGLLIVLVLAFLLFGRPGRLSGLMEDLGKGIKGFRKGLTDSETQPPPAQTPPPAQVTADEARNRETDRTGA
ncbi:MAG: twin-arginine translocase TatA/TatE family subunit [Hyphomonadaceae bacterium]